MFVVIGRKWIRVHVILIIDASRSPRLEPKDAMSTSTSTHRRVMEQVQVGWIGTQGAVTKTDQMYASTAEFDAHAVQV